MLQYGSDVLIVGDKVGGYKKKKSVGGAGALQSRKAICYYPSRVEHTKGRMESEGGDQDGTKESDVGL